MNKNLDLLKFIFILSLFFFPIAQALSTWKVKKVSSTVWFSKSDKYEIYQDDVLQLSTSFSGEQDQYGQYVLNNTLFFYSDRKILSLASFDADILSTLVSDSQFSSIIYNTKYFYKLNKFSDILELKSAVNPGYIGYLILSGNSSDIVYNSIISESDLLRSSCKSFNLSNPYDPSATLVQFDDISKTDGLSISFSVDETFVNNNNRTVYQLLTLALYRLKTASFSVSEVSRVKTANIDRRSSARIAVGIIWFLIWLSMLFLVIVTATLQTWLKPFFLEKTRKSFYYWLLIVFVIVSLVSWLGGLAGWIITGLFFVIYILTVVCIYYYYKRNKGDSQLITQLGNLLDDSPGISSTEDMVLAPETPFGRFQKSFIKRGSYGFLISLLLIFICISDVFWTVKDYQVWDRINDKTIVEFQPQMISKTIALMYDFDHMMSFLHVDWFLDIQTDYCGSQYREKLDDDEEKVDAIQNSFIGLYDIDMSIFQKVGYYEYSSPNDWFIRKIDPHARPISFPTDPKVVVSPADARLTVFKSVPSDSKIWLKHEDFTLTELLGQAVPELTGGSMVIVRLAPQDYHRFHVPLDGQIASQESLSGPLYSVNADAMRSENGALYNQRVVSIVDASFGKYAFVAIGATCVGSVVMLSKVGDTITRGDELGYFQFGGSTCVMIFPPNTITFDDDLYEHSLKEVETLTEMGMKIGLLK